MKHRHLWREYVQRLTGRVRAIAGVALLILGALVACLYQSAAIWVAYGVALVLYALLCGYLVFAQMQAEQAGFASQVSELTARVHALSAAPKLRVQLQWDQQRDRWLVIPLCTLPTEPDYELELERKRGQLQAQADSPPVLDSLQTRSAAEGALNHLVLGIRRNVDMIEAYLPRYRAYLQQDYEYRVSRCRLLPLVAVIENVGSAPATDVQLELTLPADVVPACDLWRLWYTSPTTVPQPPELPDFQRVAEGRPVLATRGVAESLTHIPAAPAGWAAPFTDAAGVTHVSYTFPSLPPGQPTATAAPLLLCFSAIMRPCIRELQARLTSAACAAPPTPTLTLAFQADSPSPKA